MILLVEDNEADAEMAMRVFKKNNPSHGVVHVQDGQDALDYLENKRNPIPGLILLDIKMPKLNGLEVLGRVKSDPDKRSIPVVMLTSSKEESDILKSYQLGANAYVVKPVDFTHFTEAIARIGSFWLVLNQQPR